MPTNINFIKNILYSLKQDYGKTATLIKILSESTNSVTGQRSVQRDVVQIRKVVYLPEDIARKYWYDMAFLKANTNFTYGGEVDIKTRQIIVEKKDLKGRELSLEDFFVLDSERYQVSKIYDLEHGLGFLLQLKKAIGALPYTVIEQFVQQVVKFNSTVAEEI